MKKILLLVLLYLVPLSVQASIVVMDMDSNRVLYGINEKEEKLIASTTKIMTAIVVIQNTDINEVITIDQSVLRSFGSGIYIEVGEEISIKDLLYGLMLRSGNDAAIALAEHIGGSEEGFAKLMNEMAESLGMYQTHFINASGLENDKGEGNTSTATDMAILMSYAMKNSIFKDITSTKHYMAKTNYKTYDWYNKNKLLINYKYTTGGKTGYTEKAYRTLVTSASKDGKNLVIVTLDQRDDFAIHESLYEEYFSRYKLVKVLDKNKFMKEEKGYIENDINMLLTDKELKNIKIEVQKIDDSTNRLGYAIISLDDEVYFKENVYKITQDKEIKSKTSLWDRIKMFFKNIFN
ncbi:MAG: D-alanyl-D-alanine carboxypeptidase [Bacilli bacterium]|nr:D-alanyl-D-alanine carboxypeptidase [Bacilli bacterium]